MTKNLQTQVLGCLPMFNVWDYSEHGKPFVYVFYIGSEIVFIIFRVTRKTVICVITVEYW